MTTRIASALALAALLILACCACSASTDGKPDIATLSGAAAVTAPPTGGSTPDQPSPSLSTPDFPSSGATGTPTEPSSGSAPGTASGTPTPSGTGGSSIVPAPATPLRTVRTQSGDGKSYVVKVWAERRDASCLDHAYGKPMIRFLSAHPCHGLDRELATTFVGGREVGISIITTSFPGTLRDPYVGASGFRKLVVKDGTGSINDLLREGYRLPSGPTSVPSPDAFNALGQDNGVNVYDVWYLQGPTPNNDKALVAMTEDIFLQV